MFMERSKIAVNTCLSLGDGAKSQGKDKNRCHYR
jgi:hypothetical protein